MHRKDIGYNNSFGLIIASFNVDCLIYYGAVKCGRDECTIEFVN